MEKNIYRPNRILLILMMCLLILSVGDISAFASQGDSTQNDSLGETSVERVPLVIDLSYPIAGAEFKLNHTEGLTFQSFEKSEETKSAIVTPIVEKNDNIHVGFFAAENSYEPQEGKLLVGYLVFNYNGEPSQSVTITETKLVHLVDNDTTESEVISNATTIKVPSDGNMNVGSDSNKTIFVLIIVAVVLAAICVVILIVRKRMLAKQAD